MKKYDTLIVEKKPKHFVVTLHRPKARNSLNKKIICELVAVLNEAERDDQCMVVIIRGGKQIFCTGLDLQDIVNRQQAGESLEKRFDSNSLYMSLLNRLATLSKVTISVVEGKVLAGGVGIVAACDFVLADINATFSLSEVLWGLLPSMVLPYLMRRVGYQPAYRMTLTSETLTAKQAEKIYLVDMLAENIERSLSLLLQRFFRVQAETIVDLKRYFNRLHPISDDQANAAIQETSALLMLPRVLQNITDFVEHQKLPWEANHE